MNDSAQKLTKNTVLFTVALILQKVLTFAFFIFIARVGGSDISGEYVGALAFTSIFSIFVDLGLAQVLIRETAKEEERGNDYFNNVFTLKIITAVFVYIFIILIVHLLDLLGYRHPSFLLIYLAGAVMILDSFVLIMHGTFRGRQNLFYESFLSVASKIVAIIVGVWGLSSGMPAYILIVAVLCASSFNFLASLWILFKKFHYKIKLTLNKELLVRLLKESWPFLMLGFFTSIYSSIDSVLLLIIRGNTEVGFYSIASKTLNGLQFIPMALVAALYPAMSALWGKQDLDGLEKVFDKGVAYLLFVGVPASLGIYILGRPIIIWAYGVQYIPAIGVFRLLLPSMIFVFLTFPVGAFLNATGRQRITTLQMGIVMAINFILNLILIPVYGFFGAGIAWVVTNVAWFLMGMWYANRIIKIDKKFLFGFFGKVFLASLAMAVVLFFTRDIIHVFFNLILGAVIYLIVAWFLKIIKKEDIIGFIQMIKSKN